MAETVTQSLLNAPLPQLVERLGTAIANAQLALDRNSIEAARSMADPAQGITIDGTPRSLLELGFTPTFYAFTETTIEAKVAFHTMESREVSAGFSTGGTIYMFTVSINASYTQKYSFDAAGSSSISTRLVSLPPPGRLHDLLLREASGSGNPG
jgi:hypothetical protein